MNVSNKNNSESRPQLSLIQLCYSGRWEEALQRLRFAPDEAQGSKNIQLLQRACLSNTVPLELVRELAALADSQDLSWIDPNENILGVLPLDCLVKQPLKNIPANQKDKVLALLRVERSIAEFSAMPAYEQIKKEAEKALRQYRNTSPGEGGPFGLPTRRRVSRKVASKSASAASSLVPRKEQLDLQWDIFSLLIKVAYYKKTPIDICDTLPLVHALADLPFWFSTDVRGLKHHSECPDNALKFAVLATPKELLLPNPTTKRGDLPLHLAVQRTRLPHADTAEEQMCHIRYCSSVMSDYDSVSYDDHNVSKIRILAKACPEAAKVRNAMGELPLFLAIKARRSWKGIEPILRAYPEAVDVVDGNNCLHAVALSEIPTWSNDNDLESNEEKEVVDLSLLTKIIDKYPYMLQTTNAKGSLPFHLAVKSGNKKWNQGIHLLYKDYPGAIKLRDGETGLYSFMLAAVSASDDGDDDGSKNTATVDLTFRLLRELPSALKQGTSSSTDPVVSSSASDTATQATNKGKGSKKRAAVNEGPSGAKRAVH